MDEAEREVLKEIENGRPHLLNGGSSSSGSWWIWPFATCTFQTIETRRKIVTLSDGNATVEVKLWASLGIFEGISCGPVPA